MNGITLGHYRILGKLGEGGMGEVYRAHDEQLDRDVAIKVLPSELLADAEARARLLREARSAASLNHPHICTIHEVGEAAGQVYIAMELVEGQPMNTRLAEGPLPAEQVLGYGLQLADALGHAHEHGIVHRDLKSGNVILTPKGRAKVLDFGLAKRLSENELDGATRSQASLTRAGAVMGTLAYMAPEQLRGQPADPRSDVWALGVVLYEMATGARPFQGKTGFELSSAILNQTPPPLPHKVPVELQAVVERCLRKEPAQRYQGGGEVHAALEAVHTGVVALWTVRRGVLGARWWWVAGAGAALVVLVAVFVFSRISRREAPAETLNITPLTSFVGMEWGPAWSPDGSFIAYAHNRYGPMNIFVIPTAGGDAVRLTSGEADDVTPRWSPDGRFISFLSDHGTGTNVFLIPPLGGSERKLVETNLPWLEKGNEAITALGASPWSHDANELLFSRLQPSGEIAVWKITLSTGVQTQLTKPPPGATDLYASWSFDGKRIVFGRNQGGKFSLCVMEARGGEPELFLGDQYVNMTPAWTADNQRLLFVSNRGGPMTLWEIDVRSRRLRQVTAGSGTILYPAISSTGRVAYTPYSHQVDLYWGQVDQPQEKHQRLTSHTQNNFGGRVSPNGNQVVYHSDRTGNYELWLLDRRTGLERNLTGNAAYDIMVDWSSDGREVVFLSNREGSLQPWVLEVESGRVRRVSERSCAIGFEPHSVGLGGRRTVRRSGSSPEGKRKQRSGWWTHKARTSTRHSPALLALTGIATADM